MSKNKKNFIIVILSIFCATLIIFEIVDNKVVTSKDEIERTLFQQSIPKETTGKYHIGVKTSKNTFRAMLTVYKTEGGEYKDLYSCPALIGKNGVGKMIEGDLKTPIGTYAIGKAYGFNGYPKFQTSKTSIPYSEITEYMYWCTDGSDKNYNKLIYSTDHPDKDYSKDKHLIDYPGNRYLLEIKYNPEAVPYRGSAIFLHCWEDSNTPTDGSIAVSENDFVNVLELIDDKTLITIY